MKRAQRTDLIREMRKSFNRYISILLIMALGVAFYAGVRSAEPDMQLSAKKHFDETNYMDIRVLGTMGMTEDDVKAIGQIAGVAKVEGGYQTELFWEAAQRDYQMTVYSMGESINQVYVTEGRLPERAEECFVDEDFMRTMNYAIGDVVTFRTEEDTEFSDILHTDTFTIVGYGKFPSYLSWQRGAVSIGTGTEDGFVFLPKEAFSMEVFTVVYATVEGAKEYNPYTEEYEDYIAKVVEKIEAIADARCEIRYEEVTAPYWEDISEAEAEIADAEKEIADGEKEIADGEKELAEAKAEIEDGEKQISDGEKELADALAEIEDGKKQLAEAEEELTAAQKEIEDGEKQLSDGEKELQDALQQLKDGEAELTAGEQDLAANKARLDAASAQISGQESALVQNEEQLNTAKAQLAAMGLPMTQELLEQEAMLTAARGQLKTAKAELLAGYQQIATGEAQLETARKELADGWVTYEEGVAELDAARKELADGRRQYEEGLAEFENAKAELEDGKKKYEDGVKELEDAKAELADGKKKYEDGLTELADARQKLADGKMELEDGKAELADARAELEEIALPEWYVLDRNTIQQFVEFGSNSERIGNLGDVFPVVFYLVAALVSLTTMTRMIEEERTQIGTMKALGYGKGAIVSKYLWYSLSATLIGGIVGVMIGGHLFPWVIINAYGILYSNIPHVLTPIQWNHSLVSVMIAVVCTIAATLSSCYKELSAVPAILMRPVAPAAGKRVFLEYIKPVWNHMNFSWKATCRNLFRYKKRFFMTIFGIGGCMALLLVGFGLRDSIMEIVDSQYKKIWTYDAYLSVNETGISIEETGYEEKIDSQMYAHVKAMDVASEAAVKSGNLFVPEHVPGMEDFVTLKDRLTDETYVLSDTGVIITEKLAKMLEVSVGDVIELQPDDVTRIAVTVEAIAENYMMHYIYMSAELYEEVFEELPEYNQLYFELKDMTAEEEEAFARAMLSFDAVDAITYVHELQETVAIMMQALELVVVVLIVAAGMLAFIVLYNLNNINIIERRRELATLKVLGFYDGEVGNYVYRENVLLTVLGIAAGVVMGFFLHRYVILTVEVDMIMFGREIELLSYVYSILLTALFAIFVNFGMFFKLRKIDMVESLKSAE